MFPLRVYFICAFILTINQVLTPSALPVKGDRPELGVRRRTTTTEGTLPAMWHKITNFFGGEGQEDGQPPRSHGRRNVETRRGRLHHDDKRRSQRESPAEKGVAVPFSLEMKMARPQVSVWEFDEGAHRTKRFGDTPSSDWATEIIVVDSDPVEDIDAENYIEEIRQDPSIFHHETFRPILIGEETAGPTLEENPPQIQIVEY